MGMRKADNNPISLYDFLVEFTAAIYSSISFRAML